MNFRKKRISFDESRRCDTLACSSPRPSSLVLATRHETRHLGFIQRENQQRRCTARVRDEIKARDEKKRARHEACDAHRPKTKRSSKDGGKRGEEEEEGMVQLPSATDDSGPTRGPIKGATRGPIYSEKQPRKCQPDGDASLYRSLKYRSLAARHC